MARSRQVGKSSEGQMSRKQKRKMLRKQKKQRRIAFHQHKVFDRNERSTNAKNVKSNSINTNEKKHKNTQNDERKAALKKGQSFNINAFTKKPVKILNKLLTSKQQISKGNNNEQKQKKKKIKTEQELQNQAEILRQEKEIEYYEKLLGVNKNKGKYKGIAKGLGYEDDLFDFLDGISQRIKQPNDELYNQYQQQQDYDMEQMQDQDDQQDSGQMQNDEHYENVEEYNEEELDQEHDQYQENYSSQHQQQIDDQAIEQQQQVEDYSLKNGQMLSQQQNGENSQSNYDHSQQQDNMYQQMYDHQSQQPIDDDQINDMWNNLGQEKTIKKTQKDNKKSTNKKPLNIKQHQITHQNQSTTKQNNNNTKQSQKSQTRRPLFGNITPQQKQQLQIRKQMNAIFNKLSDGNLMISFRQFSQIFLSAPKSSTIPVFIDLFKRFNVEVEKPHLHILLSNIALASALHHLMGNRLMAPLTYELIKSFGQYQNTPQNYEEIQQIGYSKLFEKKKNLILIFSYLYHFGSLTGQFIHSLVKYLSQSLNQHNVQFLYIIIQKIGSKVRQNDPGVLKNIIETLRESIQKFKSLNEQSNQITKINIIETQLNELKFNRKAELFSDQRMAFFATFLSKNIPKQLNTEKQVFLPSFEQIKNANISTTTWWQNLENTNKNNGAREFEQNQEDIEMINEITTERKKLIQLAKSLNLVTQIRKNIFVEIMQASDYLQAAQRVLALRIKNLHQIAVVLIQTCILEPTFNPYYPLVAAKIANINPKFKSKVQFTIWDQIKLLESYDARKTSNLAKFTARFVGNSLTDGSLTILKYFPDLINVHPYEAMFLMIFFTELLSVAKKQALAQMSSKLKQPSNTSVKDSILEYLKEVGVREKGFNNMDKMKFLRRMIMLNEKDDQDGERF